MHEKVTTINENYSHSDSLDQRTHYHEPSEQTFVLPPTVQLLQQIRKDAPCETFTLHRILTPSYTHCWCLRYGRGVTFQKRVLNIISRSWRQPVRRNKIKTEICGDFHGWRWRDWQWWDHHHIFTIIITGIISITTTTTTTTATTSATTTTTKTSATTTTTSATTTTTTTTTSTITTTTTTNNNFTTTTVTTTTILPLPPPSPPPPLTTTTTVTVKSMSLDHYQNGRFRLRNWDEVGHVYVT